MRVSRLLREMGPILGLILLAGCSSAPVDAVGLRVLPQPSAVVDLPAPTVVQHGGILTISGIVNRKTAGSGEVPGHLDLIFVNDKGDEINRVRLNWKRSEDANSASAAASYGSYHMNYSWKPSPGDALKIAYHDGPDLPPTVGAVSATSPNARVGPATTNTPGGQVWDSMSPLDPKAFPMSPQLRAGEYSQGYWGSGRK
jgi:hypothetical protein